MAQRATEQNGVKAPIQGLCRIAWDLFTCATEDGLMVYPEHLKRIHAETGLNLENLKIELGRWKKYHGHPRGTYKQCMAQLGTPVVDAPVVVDTPLTA